jgi:hypothetical protein
VFASRLPVTPDESSSPVQPNSAAAVVTKRRSCLIWLNKGLGSLIALAFAENNQTQDFETQTNAEPRTVNEIVLHDFKMKQPEG